MIGAGAVVVNDVPARAIAVGNPSGVVGYAGAIASEPAVDGRLSADDFAARLIQFQSRRDPRGRLVVAEDRNLPFRPKRLFLVDQVTPGTARGGHSHRVGHQLMVAVAGEMKIAVDDGKNAHVLLMNSPEVGLYVPPMIWSVQFGHTQGAVLLVMASEPYDRADYISDYAQFIELARQS
jgi:hypothetical protein